MISQYGTWTLMSRIDVNSIGYICLSSIGIRAVFLMRNVADFIFVLLGTFGLH